MITMSIFPTDASVEIVDGTFSWGPDEDPILKK